MYFCSSLLSVTVINHSEQKQIGKETAYFHLQITDY